MGDNCQTMLRRPNYPVGEGYQLSGENTELFVKLIWSEPI